MRCGEEQGPEVSELDEELVAGGWVEAECFIASDKDISTLEAWVFKQGAQQDQSEPLEAVPGDFREEEVDHGLVRLVARQWREVDVEKWVLFAETKGDQLLLVAYLLQRGPEYLADVIQTNDGVVQDRGPPNHVDVWVALLVLDELLQEVSVVVECGKREVRVDVEIFLILRANAGERR